jgi:hypothetical protein
MKKLKKPKAKDWSQAKIGVTYVRGDMMVVICGRCEAIGIFQYRRGDTSGLLASYTSMDDPGPTHTMKFSASCPNCKAAVQITIATQTVPAVKPQATIRAEGRHKGKHVISKGAMYVVSSTWKPANRSAVKEMLKTGPHAWTWRPKK